VIAGFNTKAESSEVYKHVGICPQVNLHNGSLIYYGTNLQLANTYTSMPESRALAQRLLGNVLLMHLKTFLCWI
jgi:ABC-type multidrug transport system ATPase subunit